MNIFHIIDFVKLAECCNFSEAADELYITQSSLSKHIQSMEKRLNTKLFHHSTRKTSLSEAGKIFLPYAKQMEEIFLQVNKGLQKIISEKQKSFTIGCMPTIAHYNVMDVIAEFKVQHPDLNVILSEFAHNSQREITDGLFYADYEMVFCDSIFLKSDKIEKIDCCGDHLVAVLHKSHPLSRYTSIELKRLTHEPLIFLNKESTTYFFSKTLCEKVGFTPNISFLGSRIENVLECVAKNMGIALLMKKFTSLVNNDDIAVLEIEPTAQRTISFARLKNYVHTDSADTFWKYISAIYKPAAIKTI
jgi:DNA-binding transcriptional LysR family regulator